MGLAELLSKEVITAEDTEEFERLCSRLRSLCAAKGIDPWPVRGLDEMRSKGMWPRSRTDLEEHVEGR